MGRIPLAPEDWFEKKFEFYLPVGAFASVLERVRGTPARLEELVQGIPVSLLTVRPGADWSVQEHIGHLSDLETLHEGRLDDYAAGKDVLRAADLTNSKTYEAQHNSGPVEDLLARFREVRASFVGKVEGLSAEEASRSAIHPRLNKQMRVIDLLQFVAEHDDHHLAAMRHLAQELAESAS